MTEHAGYLRELKRFGCWGMAKSYINEHSDGHRVLMIFKDLRTSPLTAYMEDQYVVMELLASKGDPE